MILAYIVQQQTAGRVQGRTNPFDLTICLSSSISNVHPPTLRLVSYVVVMRAPEAQPTGATIALEERCCVLHAVTKKHQTLPFHRIWSWTDGPSPYFELASPQDRNFVLYLGHAGQPCPQPEIGEHEISILHTNGVHPTTVQSCGCQGQKHWEQLLHGRLLPGTDDIPKSAFTFDVLRHFHAFNLTSKTAAHDFNQALLQLTDGVQPSKFPVCCA